MTWCDFLLWIVTFFFDMMYDEKVKPMTGNGCGLFLLQSTSSEALGIVQHC